MQFFIPLLLLSIHDRTSASDSGCAYQIVFVPRLSIDEEGSLMSMREDLEPVADEV